jgi:hypothetical protein
MDNDRVLTFFNVRFPVSAVVSTIYDYRMGEGRDVSRVLVGIPEGKRPMWIPRRRWENNIKLDLQEVRCGVWTGLSWLRIETGGGHL